MLEMLGVKSRIAAAPQRQIEFPSIDAENIKLVLIDNVDSVQLDYT